MARVMQGLQHTARQLQIALYRLIAIGIDPHRQRPGHIAACRQLALQHLHHIALGNDLGLKVQPRRQAQIAVCGPRITIHAAVFTTSVGVDGLFKMNIGRAVAADDAFGVFQDHLGVWRGLHI